MWRKVAEGSRPPTQCQRIRQRLFALLLVDGRPPNHPLNCDFWPERWNHHGVPVFESLHVALNPVEQKVVNVNILHEHVAAIVLEDAQRSSARRPPRRKQGIQRSRQRTNVICARLYDIANDIDANRS